MPGDCAPPGSVVRHTCRQCVVGQAISIRACALSSDGPNVLQPQNGQVQAWNPIWHVSTILNATQSFMNDESRTSGSMHAPPAERHKLARQSLANSCKHPMFRKLFPHLVEKHQKQVQEEEEQKQQEAEDAARQKAGSAEAGAGGKRPGGDARVGSIGHTIWRLIPSAFVAVMALGILLVQYLPSRR